VTSLEAEHALPAEDGQPRVGLVVLVLFTASIFGFATVVTMLGPLLVDLSRELDVSLGQAGLLAAAMAVPWALGAPFAGVLSDRFGRRPSIVLALVGVGAATIGAGLAPNFGVLMALRVLAGIFGGFGPAAVMAAIGDLFPPTRRGMAMGWMNMGFSLAAIVGTPAVGVVGGALGWRWAFAATGLLLLALGLVFRLGFPSVRTPFPGGSMLATYRAVLDVPGLGSVLGANLLERALFNLGVLYLPSFLILSYALDPVTVAPTLSLVAVGSVVGNIAGGWLGDRLPKAAIFVVAQATAGLIALALFSLPVGLAISAIGGALFGLVNAISRPALLALGTELSTRHRGAVLGVLSLTNQGGIVLGSSLGGVAIGLGGYAAIAGVMFGGGSLASAMALPLLRRPRQLDREQPARS
jgi:predicted MFS family arabinose efflux permease